MAKSFANKQQVIDHINNILMELFELDKSDLTLEKNLFTDLGLDSLDAIDMIIKFKKDFDIKPPNEKLMAIKTVADVYNLVDEYYVETAKAEH